MNIDEKKLKELQEALPSLNELDLLECLWNSDNRSCIFNELYDRYLIPLDEDDDEYYYSDESEKINAIKPYIIEWFGENYAFAIKDGEYILLSFAMMEDFVKYWDTSKINVNNKEMARKVAYLISFMAASEND